MIKRIYATALLTAREGIRQRILYGALLLALGVCCFAVLISGLFMRDLSKIILDFCLSSVALGGLLVPFFLAINLLSRDMEQKTIFTILSRPVGRAEYIVGKYAGLLVLATLVMVFLTGATYGAVWFGKMLYGTSFFTSFSPLAVLTAVLGSWLAVALLTALVVLWCSVTTSSFLATLLTVATYLIGQSIDDVIRFLAADIPGVEIAPVTRGVAVLARYLFPNLAAFDLKVQAAHGIIMAPQELLTLLVYGVTYVVAVLALAVLIFKRRDIV
ncbi:ABC transporter permease [Desulfolithobacter sp.]